MTKEPVQAFVVVDPFVTASRDGGTPGFGATGITGTVAHPSPRLGAPRREGSLSKDEVKAGLLPQLRLIGSCYDASLHSDGPQSGGQLKVAFVIGVKGEVLEAGVESAGPGLSQALQRCVVEAVRRVKTAPPKGGEARVVYPFTFSPGE